MLQSLILCGIGTMLASMVFVYLGMRIATCCGFVAKPNPMIKTHTHPVPLGGGIAINVVVLGCLLALAQFHQISWRIPLLGLLPVFLIGLVDDLKPLKPKTKVFYQCIAIGIYLAVTPLPIWLRILAGLFLLYTQNAWNVLDVMDGLVGYPSVVCFLGIAAMTCLLLPKHLSLAWCSVIVAGGVAGFLVWNTHPARVYMGDAGSMSLGMMFGILAVEALTAGWKVIPSILLIGIIPLFEAGFLIIERSRRGIKFYEKSPDHFALRLLNNGYRVPVIISGVIVWGIMVAIAGTVTLKLAQGSYGIVPAIVCILIVLIGAFRYFDPFNPEGKKEPARQLSKK